MASADLSLTMLWTTPDRLILKFSWDNERPDSYNFALGRRKKSTGAISGN
jgi:hypothetical protein